MSDARALVRLMDELLFCVRRCGVEVSTAQAIDAVRATATVGLEDRDVLRAALACVLVTRTGDLASFHRAFDEFFSRAGATRTLFERLRALGFSAAEIDVLADLLAREAEVDASGMERLGALLEGGAELDRLMLLAGVSRSLASVSSPMQAGFFAQRIVDRIGTSGAQQKLSALRALLVDALGSRGEEMAAALSLELSRTAEQARERVRARSEESLRVKEGSTASRKSFSALTLTEIAAVRRAVRSFAARLRGAERARQKRARRGRIDPHKTLRRALRTAGVPFSPSRKKRRRDRPKLLVLCDVSDSVRSVATFLLEFTFAAQELFGETRTFVFVSELGETTDLFARQPIERALAVAYGGGVVSVSDNSNYGRMLRAFEQTLLPRVDRRTTVVVLGDGRTNYHDDEAAILGRVRERARAVIWLCPEARASWASGDSAMPRYAKRCTEVVLVRTALDLETAARRILAKR